MNWFSKLFKNDGGVPPAILPKKNDQCWCGSGIKYKKCHMSKDKLYFKKHPKKKIIAKAATKKACNPVFG